MRVDYEKTLKDAERDEQDLDYIAKHHAFTKVMDQFDEGFLRWFQYMESSMYLQAGGYPFHGEDFTEVEWQAMGIIANHYKAKQWQSMQAQPKSPL